MIGFQSDIVEDYTVIVPLMGMWEWGGDYSFGITYGHTLAIAAPTSGLLHAATFSGGALNGPSFGGGALDDEDFGGNIA